MLLYFSTPVKQISKDRDIASLKEDYDTIRKKQIRRQDSPFRENKVRLNLESLPKGIKRRIPGIAQANSDPANFILTEDIELVAVIDRDCLDQVRNGNFRGNARLAEEIHEGSRFRDQLNTIREISVPFRPRSFLSLASLRQEADSDICLKGIGLEGTVSKTGLYDDPRSEDQNQNGTVEVLAVEDIYYASSLQPKGDTVIAIIDTGVDYGHQDLNPRMWQGTNNNYGYDFVNNDFDPYDDEGHGTHVAGLASAAGGNDIGLSGIAAAGVEIMAVKVLDSSGSGSYSNVANGIRWAADEGAHVINLSLSGSGLSSIISDAIVYAVNKGVVVVAAAGNNAKEIDYVSSPYTPGSFGRGINGMLTVGSVDSITLQRSYFSNFSSSYVEIASPGSNGIFSTTRGNSYAAYQGTSMAAPIAGGVIVQAIAALRSREILYTPAEIENMTKDYANKIISLESSFEDGNLVNALSLSNAIIRKKVITGNAGEADGL